MITAKIFKIGQINHFHNIKGEVEASPLQGSVFEDLDDVLKKIKSILVSNEI